MRFTYKDAEREDRERQEALYLRNEEARERREAEDADQGAQTEPATYPDKSLLPVNPCGQPDAGGWMRRPVHVFIAPGISVRIGGKR